MNLIESPMNGVMVITHSNYNNFSNYTDKIFINELLSKLNLCSLEYQFKKTEILKKSTLKGLNYQFAEYNGSKIVTCLNGCLFYVIVDLRNDSRTYLKWFGIELNGNNQLMLSVPYGFAYGFLTLKENTEILEFLPDQWLYQSERGIRYDDSCINIEWPINPEHISDIDKNIPNYNLDTIV